MTAHLALRSTPVFVGSDPYLYATLVHFISFHGVGGEGAFAFGGWGVCELMANKLSISMSW
jgi:hypothetical protein